MTGKMTSVPLVDSVAKSLQILDCFNEEEPELDLSRICRKTGINKSRVFRLCETLMKSDYLLRTSSKSYTLGPKLLVLGNVYERSNVVKSLAIPYMKKVTRLTGESTALYILDRKMCVCIARNVQTSRIVYLINEGDMMEPAPTASGRVLLAYSDSETVDEILNQSKGIRYTDMTLVDINEIKQRLDRVRQDGYGVNHQEFEDGISAVAAPIFDRQGQVVAAFAIVGPDERFIGSHLDHLIAVLLQTTKSISALFEE